MSVMRRRAFLSQFTAGGLVAGAGLDWPERAAAFELSRVFTPNPQATDAQILAAARRELLIPPEVTYCNTGTWGASPREVIDATTRGLRSVEEDLPGWAYRNSVDDVPLPPATGYRPFSPILEEIGALMNAPVDELAFTQNATIGMGLLANGLKLEAGDEILTTNAEHPGGLSGWLLREQRHGVVVRQVALEEPVMRGRAAVVEAFAQAITPRTRVVMFSHITSTLGIRLPVRELCDLAQQSNALAIVDGAQALGQMPVDVKALGCDAYVTNGHKWLLAPKGTGLLYVSREIQGRFWSTLPTAGYDDPSLGAFRLVRSGTGSLPQLLGLQAAVRFMSRLSLERVERWDRMLTTRLREGLAAIPHVRVSSPADPGFAAAMTTFKVSGRTSAEVQDALWTERIRVRAEGEAGVRFSAHFYVDPSDIDRALRIVDSLR